MVISGAAAWVMVIFILLFGLITVAVLGALAFALIKIQQQVEKLTTMAEPVIVKVGDTLETVQRITINVGEKADHILTRGEALTENVSDKVEKTTGVVQTAVTKPLINLSSLITGVTKGVAVYTHATHNGNAKKQAKK